MVLTLLVTFFTTSILITSLLVLLLPNPIHSLLCLVLAFINATGILMVFNIDFIGLLIIIIYVGAIAVLFLFILMMLDINTITPIIKDWSIYVFFSCLIGILFFMVTYWYTFHWTVLSILEVSPFIMETNQFVWVQALNEINNCATFGHVLYSYHLFYLLIAGLILLLALLGAVRLTYRSVKPIANFSAFSKCPKIYLIN